MAGCGEKASAPAPPQDTRARPDARQQIETMLAERASRARRRARGLGIRKLRYRITGGTIEAPAAVVDVRLEYGVRGVRGSFGVERTLVLRRRGGRWRVRSERQDRQRLPWEVGRFRRVTTPHFVVWAPPEVDPVGGGLTSALEDGYAQMRGVLKRGTLRKRYLVLVAGDARQARRMTSAIRGLESLTALTDTEVQQSGPAQRVRSVTSQRLIVVWPAFSAAGPDGQRIVVAHELTHAAVAPSTSGRTPSWLTEGLALYVSDDRRVAEAAQLVASASASRVRRALSLTTLSDPDAIGRLSGDAQSAAYAYASAAAAYIAERYGRDKLLALYDAYNRPRLRGSGPELTDAAVRSVLRVPLVRLERDLRRWIVTRAVVEPFAP